jgi:hypothetical protein
MYSELQSAIKSFLESDTWYFYSGAIVLEDQPGTPDEFQKKLNLNGWAVLIGKPIIRKEGLFYKVYNPIMADENKQVNRSEGGPNKTPQDVMTHVETTLQDYQPAEIWTPLKLQDFKQVFPEEGKAPWAIVAETKTFPRPLVSLNTDLDDLLVTETDDEILAT